MRQSGGRGGARQGAGRPALEPGVRREAVSAHLPPWLLAAVDARAARDQVSRSEAVTRCLADWYLACQAGVEFPAVASSQAPPGVPRPSRSLLADLNAALAVAPHSEAADGEEPPELPPEDAEPGGVAGPRLDFSDYAREFGYYWDLFRHPRDPAERAAFLRQAVEIFQLKGHEKGFHEPRALRQVKSLYDNDRQYSRLLEAVDSKVSEIIENWELFATGQWQAVISLPHLNYQGSVSADEVARRFSLTEQDLIAWDPGLVMVFGGASAAEAGQDEDIEPITLSEVEANYREALVELVLDHLHENGVLRGPCRTCGFASWPAPARIPGVPGRPPASLLYCPACLAAKKRARQAESKRRQRARQRVQQRGPVEAE